MICNLLRMMCLYALAVSFYFTSSSVADEQVSKVLGSYTSGLKKAQVGALFVDVATGNTVFSKNADDLMTPASVVKVITSYAALKLLGDEYRLPTEIFADLSPQGAMNQSGVKKFQSIGGESSYGDASYVASVGNLYVRGYGDPGIVSETLLKWAHRLKAVGVKAIDNLVIDDSLFIEAPKATGPRAYQAALNSVSLNHNCYALTITPTVAGEPAIVSLTPGSGFATSFNVLTVRGDKNSVQVHQKPDSASYDVELARSRGAKVANGKSASKFITLDPQLVTVQVQGAISAKFDAVEHYYAAPDASAYFGYVFKHYLELSGIKVGGAVLNGETPAETKLVEVFESDRLGSLLVDLNHYSNNFIAGQLLYAMGQDSVGYFRQATALERIGELLSQLGITPDTYSLVDGSGLNRENKLTPKQLVTVLLAATKDMTISPVFMASMSHYGKTGTLKKRSFATKKSKHGNTSDVVVDEVRAMEATVWAKTGTLDGVSSLVGYVMSADNRLIAFAMITNGENGKSEAVQYEDNMLRAIASANVAP